MQENSNTIRKQVILIAISIIGILFLFGCGTKKTLSDNPVVFEQGVNEEYAYLSADGRIYVPYCPFEQKYLGNCIGYCDISGDENTGASRLYIYELKGYSSEEWIIETLDLDNCNEGMILREINAVNIPEGLESEYEWNQ